MIRVLSMCFGRRFHSGREKQENIEKENKNSQLNGLLSMEKLVPKSEDQRENRQLNNKTLVE